ncbi:hypothetical protein [Spartinivicinus ruber]|uniref:hypothetical protein n=1 Tax=Spartinivicinus ruber TaxID=2683272 RepID=UPI0013CF8C56|nr:hypothetical protein [Spartinivicinus ruber]
MNSLNFVKLLSTSTIAIGLLFPGIGFAIEKINLTNHLLNKGFNSLYQSSLSSILELSNQEKLVVLNQVNFKSGKSISRIQQHYQDIPVWGVTLTATQASSGNYENLSGFQVKGLKEMQLSLAPNLTQNQVMIIAKQYIGATNIVNKKLENKQKNCLFILKMRNQNWFTRFLIIPMH